jgi:hypothetical protein
LDSREPQGFLLARGVRLKVDGRPGDIPRKNVWGNSDSPRHDFGELVRLLVVLAGYVVQLYAVELVLESPHGIAVRLHLVTVIARVLHELVDHELRVSPNVEVLDAHLDGDSKASKKGVILCHVV